MARQEFPPWAFLDGIRRVEDEPEKKEKIFLPAWFDRFKRNHTILIACVLFLAVWTAATCMITGSIVRHNTNDDMMHYWRGLMQEKQERIDVLESIVIKLNAGNAMSEEERSVFKGITGEGILTGKASLESAITEDAKLLSIIGQGVMNTYPSADVGDAEKVMICALCRVFSGGEFAGITSIADAVNQPGQWWGYSDGLRYTDEVYSVAMKLSSLYHTDEPMPCSTDMVYAKWNGHEIVLRNQWEANDNAKYY